MPSVSPRARQCRSVHTNEACAGPGCLIHFPQDRDTIRRSISDDKIASGLVPMMTDLAVEQWAASPGKQAAARGVGGRGYHSSGVEAYKKAPSVAKTDAGTLSAQSSRSSLASLYNSSPNHMNAPAAAPATAPAGSGYQSNAYTHSRAHSAGHTPTATATAVGTPPPVTTTPRASHSRNSLSLSSSTSATYVPSPLSQSITSRTLLLNPLADRVALASSTSTTPTSPSLSRSATRPPLSRSCRYEPSVIRPLYIPQQYALAQSIATSSPASSPMGKTRSLPLPYTTSPAESLACELAKSWDGAEDLSASVAGRKAEVAKHLKGAKVAGGGEVVEVEGWWGSKE